MKVQNQFSRTGLGHESLHGIDPKSGQIRFLPRRNLLNLEASSCSIFSLMSSGRLAGDLSSLYSSPSIPPTSRSTSCASMA